MLLITGPGRCGSSVMAKLLQSLGYGLGKMISYDHGLRAGMEFAPAYAINRDLYDDFIYRKRKIDLDEEIETPYWGRISYRDRILRIDKDDVLSRPQGKVEVIKDPRFTWHPDIISSWFEVRRDICLLFLERDPAEVIASRMFVMDDDNGWDNFYDPKREERLEEFIDDLEEFIRRLNEIGIFWKKLKYPNFLYDLEKTYLVLQELGYVNYFEFSDCETKWKEIIEYNLIHNFSEVKNDNG